MNEQPLLLEKADSRCRLILNREDKCHAINEEMIECLDESLANIERDDAIRIVELTATGDRFFCAGGDIKSWSAYSALDMGRKWIKRGNAVFSRLRALPKLTVANLNGHAIGGGLELALCCDMRIARSSARFSTPEVTLGMIPGWMGIERLFTQIGASAARKMLLLGERLNAQEAERAGLIDAVVESGEADAWIRALAERVEKCGPVALAHIKQLIISLESKHTAYEHQLLAALMSATEDCRNATSAFVEKRSPSFVNK